MIRAVDIAWLTGLLEGEGSFLMSGRSIMISVDMIDRDIIERAAALMGGHVYHHAPGADKPHWKLQWHARLKARAPRDG